jgi:glutathione S-transferase
MLTLYFCPGLCSLASHITLEESGAEYAVKPIMVFKGEHQSDAYKKINARGKVPALDIDGVILVENAAIMAYVANRFPNANLKPKDPLEEARWLSLMTWFSNTLHPSFAQIFRADKFSDDKNAHPAIKEAGKKAALANLTEIDHMLAGKQWIMGNQFTTCDAYAMVFYSWGSRAELPVKDLKNYTAWKDRMLQRPAVRRILEREDNPLLKAA